jgi:diguanylate cyclase (GGDEF)-like protein
MRALARIGCAVVLALLAGAVSARAESVSLSTHAQTARHAVGSGLVDAHIVFTLDEVGAGTGDLVLVLPKVESATVAGAIAPARTGTGVPLARRALPYAVPAFAIPAGTSRTTPIVLDAIYAGDQPFEPALRDRIGFEAGLALARLIQGLFIGVLLAVLFFNVFAFFGLREQSSIYFAVYVLSLIFNEIVTTGLGDQYLWPAVTTDARLWGLVANSVGFASFVVFARSLLSTRAHVRRLDGVLIAVTVVQLSVAVLQYALPIGRSLALPLFAIEICGSLLVAAIGIVRWAQGYGPARFFVIAFLPSTVGVLANLYYDAFLPSGNWFFAQNGVEIGTALLCVIITCSIVDKMRILERERRRAQAVAATDGLTGIANRMAFYDTLQRALDDATPESRFGLLYVDLDGFKPINDRHGHRVGDELLRIVARRLEAVVRPSDLVARIGGDEFAIFLSELSSTTRLEQIAAQCRKSIGDQVVIDGTKLKIGASVGTAMFPTDGKAADDLMESADRRMYAEKQTT